MRNRYSNKIFNVDGILSHFQLSQEEVFSPISTIIERYQVAHPKKYKELAEAGNTPPNSDKNYTNIEIILASIEDMLRAENQAHKIPEIRKNFFDMCIFDIKFANRDRHDDNFGLRINQATNEIEFYPLFDNEQILGFQEEKKDVIKFLSSDLEYEKFKKRELTSCIGIPERPNKIPSMDLLKYLLENYYDETMESIKSFERFKIDDLERVMDLCSGLSEEHRQLARKIFLEREKEMVDVIKQHSDKNRKDREPGL